MKQLTFICILAFVAWAQSLASKRLCSMLFHTATVNKNNNLLYYEGGDLNILNGTKIVTRAISRMVSLNLSESFDNNLFSGDFDTRGGRLFNSIQKHFNETVDTGVTTLDGGAAFSYGDDLFFYGGYSSPNGGPEVIPRVGATKYNIPTNKWSKDGFGGSLFYRLSFGLTAQSDVDGIAYYLGGVVVPGGNPEIVGGGTYIQQGLMTLDMKTQQWKNHSSEGINEYGTVVDGYMNLIEEIGDQGILVAFGGLKASAGAAMSILTKDNLEPDQHNPMDKISIYDIANEVWYTQQATGDIPTWRMSGCSVVAAAPDKSSFSIYTFGGLGVNTTESDGDVYILSIPSFRWIRIETDAKLRIKHKCVIGNKHTMVVVGGNVPEETSEWVPTSESGCDTQGEFANGFGFFDMRSHVWVSNYDATDDGDYELADSITKVIGGNKTGGATKTEPEKGYNDTGVANVVKKRNNRVPGSSTTTSSSSSSTSNSSSSSSSKKSLSGGAIAGICVGSIAGAAIIAALVALGILRKKRKNQAAAPVGEPPVNEYYAESKPPAELSGIPTAHELQTSSNAVEKDGTGRQPVAQLDNTQIWELDGTGRQ